MPTTADSLAAVRDAIEGLRVAAREDNDEQRADVAQWLDGLFAGVQSRAELKAAVTESTALFRGGMGSFQDVSTAVMDRAVERLRQALWSAMAE